MKSTDINEKVLDVYGQLPLDWLHQKTYGGIL